MPKLSVCDIWDFPAEFEGAVIVHEKQRAIASIPAKFYRKGPTLRIVLEKDWEGKFGKEKLYLGIKYHDGFRPFFIHLLGRPGDRLLLKKDFAIVTASDEAGVNLLDIKEGTGDERKT